MNQQLHAATVTINGTGTSPSPSPQSIEYTHPPGTQVVYTLTGEGSEAERGDDSSKYTMQYYTTVEPQSGENSPHMLGLSPTEARMPVNSGTTSTSSESSSGPEMGIHQSLCVPSSAGEGTQSDSGGSTVKQWTYEEQFKQVRCLHEAMVVRFIMYYTL